MFCSHSRSLFAILTLVTAMAQAEVNVAPAVVDLGRQKPEAYATAQVRLTNTGPDSVELQGTSADCGCTVATLEKKTLASGASAPLGLVLETPVTAGPMRRTVWVQTSAGQITIPITVDVVPYRHWLITPAAVVLPKPDNGRSRTTTVTLQHMGGAKVTLGKISCQPAWIDVAAATDDGEIFTLTLVTRGGAPYGGQPITVDVETTDAAEPHVTFNVVTSDRFAESKARARNAARKLVPPAASSAPHP